MMKKMMKRAIAVGLAIAVTGVLVPTNLQSVKPEAQAAEPTGYWEKTDTIFTKHDESCYKTILLPGQKSTWSDAPEEVDVDGTKMIRFKYTSSRSGVKNSTADWSCTWVSEGEIPPDRVENDKDFSLKLNLYVENAVLKVTENVSDWVRIYADSSGREYYKHSDYNWTFTDANGTGSFSESIITPSEMKDVHTTVTGRVRLKNDMTTTYKDGDKRSVYFFSYGGQMEWVYTYRSGGGSSSTTAPSATSTPKPSAAPTVKPTSAPTVTTAPTSAPVVTPVPTTEPVVTPVPTSDPGTGDTTDYRSKPKFKTYWTHNQDVLNIYSTSGTKVKVKPLNKLAKSSSIKWIKNGKTAKICWIKNYKPGKYKFRFTCKGTASWKPGKKTWVITAS